MLGVGVMPNEIRFVFLLGSLVVFVLAVLGVGNDRLRLVSLGLALFATPMAWDSFALGFD